MVAAAPREAPPRDPARLSLFTLVTGGHPGPLAAGEQRASLDEVARWGMKRQLVGHALRYRQARAVTLSLIHIWAFTCGRTTGRLSKRAAVTVTLVT